MLVDNINFINEGEKLIPSRFTMWSQFEKRTVKSCSGSLGQSLLYGNCKPICFFGERELERSSLTVVDAKRRNNFPIGVIEGGPNIMSNIPDYQTGAVYDGFILVGENASFSGAGICLNDESERSRFIEKFVKLNDVFRGPIQLEKCAICHAHH